jgi:hypothetical protein
LSASAITEICVGWAPPALRTIEGEFVFVAAPRVRLLAEFATRYEIPFVRREDDARTLRRLGELGTTR